jgi:putative SOS response-associated peptidase YedK
MWLDPGVANSSQVADLMKPFDLRLMRMYPVSSKVGNVKNDGSECAEESEAVSDDAAQSSLF